MSPDLPDGVFAAVRPWDWDLQLWLEKYADFPELPSFHPHQPAAKNARCRVCGGKLELRKYRALKPKAMLSSFVVLCRKHALRVAYGRQLEELPMVPSLVAEMLPGLGRRHTTKFEKCTGCGEGTFQAYGDSALCLGCARTVERLSGGGGE